MEINLKTLKFNPDQKLVEYVNKKVARLEKFFPAGGNQTADVTLSLGKTPDNKESAITDCVDAMKEKLTRAKEKLYEK